MPPQIPKLLPFTSAITAHIAQSADAWTRSLAYASALVSSNDLGIFSEVTEAAVFRGANEEQSDLLQMSLCVSGVASAPALDR